MTRAVAAHDNVRKRVSIVRPTDHTPRVDQDAETALVRTEAGWREVRLHDYAELFAIPGLYEAIFAELLACDSPTIVVDELAHALQGARVDPRTLRALDLGAGNGMVAERLSALGVPDIVGLDRLCEAADAAHRDRPGLYRDYIVGDVTTMTEVDLTGGSANRRPNLLVCVAALGFGDIPVEAFTAALALLEPQSWLAVNLNSRFLDTASDTSGFASILHRGTAQGRLTIHRRHSYVHRRSQAGEPLQYTSIIARTA